MTRFRLSPWAGWTRSQSPFHLTRSWLAETHLGLRRLQTQLRDANHRLQEANLRLEHELSLAGKVQTSFLPSQLPEVAGWDIFAALKPARQTSGDSCDAIVLPSGLLGLLVADVVDKGVGAALFMALSWILIRTYATEYPTRSKLAPSAVNHRLLTGTTTDQFVTVFYGILDPATGVLNYCNAGHPPPFLCGTQEGDLTRPLDRTGMALGAVETATWEQSTVQLNPGSTLLLYSDGVTDAEDEQGRFFGHEILGANLSGRIVCLASQAVHLGLAKGQREAEDLSAPVDHCQILGRSLSFIMHVRVVE